MSLASSPAMIAVCFARRHGTRDAGDVKQLTHRRAEGLRTQMRKMLKRLRGVAKTNWKVAAAAAAVLCLSLSSTTLHSQHITGSK